MKEWTKEWPTEPGWYWFFGWPYSGEKDSGREPELNTVEVIEIPNDLVFVRRGSFWYKSDGGEGLFRKATVPPLPNVAKFSDGTRMLVTHPLPKGGRGGFFHSKELAETGKAMLRKAIKESKGKKC